VLTIEDLISCAIQSLVGTNLCEARTKKSSVVRSELEGNIKGKGYKSLENDNSLRIGLSECSIELFCNNLHY